MNAKCAGSNRWWSLHVLGKSVKNEGNKTPWRLHGHTLGDPELRFGAPGRDNHSSELSKITQHGPPSDSNTSSKMRTRMVLWGILSVFVMLLMGGTLMGGERFLIFVRFCHESWRSDVVCHLRSVTILSCKCCAALVLFGCHISLRVRFSVPCAGASGCHRSPHPPQPVSLYQSIPHLELFHFWGDLVVIFEECRSWRFRSLFLAPWLANQESENSRRLRQSETCLQEKLSRKFWQSCYPNDPSVLKIVIVFYNPYRVPGSCPYRNKHFWALSVAFRYCRSDFLYPYWICSPYYF